MSVEHPADTSVNSDKPQISISGQGVRRAGRTFPISDKIRKATSATPSPPGRALSLTEGDLIIGKRNGSAIGTLVERATRYVMLLHLPDDHTSESVRDEMIRAIKLMPHELRKTVTWDQGSEMASHAEIAIATNIKIFFCDPHSPWQRGSNENTNGLLRQYFPKGTDLSVHTHEDLEHVARQLNNRPRKTLGFHTPKEKLNELLLNPPEIPAVATTA